MVLQGPCGCGKRTYVGSVATAYGLPFVVPEDPDTMAKVLKYCVAAPGVMTSTGCVPLARVLGAVTGRPQDTDEAQEALLARLPTVHYLFGLEADEDPRQATAELLAAAAADALMPGLFVIGLNEFPFPLRALRTSKAVAHVTLPSTLPDLRQQAIAKAWRHVGAVAHAAVDADLLPEERADVLEAMGPDGAPVDGHPCRVRVCRSTARGPHGLHLRVRVAAVPVGALAGCSVTHALRRVARGQDPVWEVDAAACEHSVWAAVAVPPVLLDALSRGQVVLEAFRDLRASRRHAVHTFLQAALQAGQATAFGARAVPAPVMAALADHLQGLALDPEDTALLRAEVVEAGTRDGPEALLRFGPGHVPSALHRVVQHPRVRLHVKVVPVGAESGGASASASAALPRVGGPCAPRWQEAALDHAVLARVGHTVTNMPAAVTWLLSTLSCPLGASLDTEWACVQMLLEGWGPSVSTTFWGTAMGADGFQGVDWTAVLDTRSTADLQPFYAHALSALPILQARTLARACVRARGASAGAGAGGASKITIDFKDPMCNWHAERQRRQEVLRDREAARNPQALFSWRDIVEGPAAFTPGHFAAQS